MGVRILHGRYDGCGNKAVLIDSVSGTAFGPMFDDAHEAEAFLGELRTDGVDARALDDDELVELVIQFRKTYQTDDDGAPLAKVVPIQASCRAGRK